MTVMVRGNCPQTLTELLSLSFSVSSLVSPPLPLLLSHPCLWLPNMEPPTKSSRLTTFTSFQTEGQGLSFFSIWLLFILFHYLFSWLAFSMLRFFYSLDAIAPGPILAVCSSQFSPQVHCPNTWTRRPAPLSPPPPTVGPPSPTQATASRNLEGCE